MKLQDVEIGQVFKFKDPRTLNNEPAELLRFEGTNPVVVGPMWAVYRRNNGPDLSASPSCDVVLVES